MANLTESPTWEAGIYQLEETDPVQAGPNGVDNKAPKQLANRTAYLKQDLDNYKTSNNQALSTLSTTVGNNKTETDAALAALRGVGQISFYPGTTAPNGWLKANGAILSRSAYPELWAFASTRLAPNNDTYGYPGLFGSGDGSTTFKLPDVRELFPRFWSDGGGPQWQWSRQAGSREDDMIKQHNHVTYPYNKASAKASDVSGVNRTPGSVDDNTTTAEYKVAAMSSTDWTAATIIPFGGEETRPRNVALLGCIKY